MNNRTFFDDHSKALTCFCLPPPIKWGDTPEACQSKPTALRAVAVSYCVKPHFLTGDGGCQAHDSVFEDIAEYMYTRASKFKNSSSHAVLKSLIVLREPTSTRKAGGLNFPALMGGGRQKHVSALTVAAVIRLWRIWKQPIHPYER